MIKKLKFVTLTLAAVFMIGAAPAYAQGSGGGPSCGSTKTEFIACDSKTGTGTIGDLIKIALMVMTVGIGVVATGGLAYAAIIYASARDDQGKVSEAKTIIRNIIIGLILYGFTVAILAWLLPGSVIDAPEQSPTQSGAPSTSQNPSQSNPPTQ